jgi:DNA-binding NtrC family response regulator
MKARLTLETGEAKPTVYDLEAGKLSLGRNRRSDIVLEDRFASKHHAEIVAVGNGWLLRDLQSTNDTRVNGRRIIEATLHDQDVIAIGDIQFRFAVAADKTDEMPPLPQALVNGSEHEDEPVAVVSPVPSSVPDSLSALEALLSDFQKAATPQDLVGRALAAVCRQTHASLAGYLSLDPEDPLQKTVHPPEAAVDAHLSRQLTQRVRNERRPVWLNASEGSSLDTESLVAYRDAVCIPLCPPQGGDADPLGALHVYKTGGVFCTREARFCEVLAGFLAGQLHAFRARRALEADNSRLRIRDPGGADLVGDSPAMQQLRQQIDRVADGPATVLVVGETGAGKELVAAGLHRRSRRHEGPFVAVNCPALAPTLIESELFGHKARAFTGATEDRSGCFAQADEGTLFLDEIGELTPDVQAKLLRVLETRRFTPVGGTEQGADVRVVVATNRDLRRAVQEGRFRDDLFYRLTVIIKVPPLRDHLEDVPALVHHFLDRFAGEYRRRPRLTEGAMEKLMAYHWPGNVRQLRAVLEAAVGNGVGDDPIHATDLLLVDVHAPAGDGPPTLNLEELEAWAVRKALERHAGHRIQAARELGIHRDTLAEMMKRYRIPAP